MKATQRYTRMVANRTPSANADQVDAEIDALLAKIPDKYRAAAAAKDAIRRKKRQGASWKCEPVTIVISMALFTCIGVLVFLSMSSRPFWAFKELHGDWVAEPQGSGARRIAVNNLDDQIHINCAAPDILRSLNTNGEGQAADGTLSATLDVGDSDKLVGHLPIASCQFTFGPFHVHSSRMLFQSVRANSAVWTWTGRCVDDDDDAAGRMDGAVCTLTIHRKHVIFVVHDSSKGAAYSFLLTRWDGGDTGTVGGFAGFWKDKGRFAVLIVSMVVILKLFQYVLSPKKDVAKKLREERLRRALQRDKAMNTGGAPQ